MNDRKKSQSQSEQQYPSPYARANIAFLYYSQSNDLRWLEVAVSALDEALEEPESDSWERTHARFLLGQGLVERYHRMGNLSDLEWGIRRTLEAVEATPLNDPDRAKRLEFLANSLLEALERFTPEEMKSAQARSHLRRVISSLEECVHLTPPDDPALPWRLSSLGLASRLRFEHSRDGNDVDKAQEYFEEAIALAATADPVQRAGIYGNLGTVLMRRYEVTGDRESLEAALKAFQRAAADSTPGSPHHADHLRNLALALAGKDDAIANEAFAAAAGSPAQRPWFALRFPLSRKWWTSMTPPPKRSW